MATQPTTERSVTGWVGWVWFGGIMLVTIGLFNAFQGFIALIDDEFAAPLERGIAVIDLTTWGWIHLAIGALLVFAGFGVLAGATWGRVLGVVIAALNLLAQLPILPVYPTWALIVIILDAVVIYALVVHGAEAAEV